MKERPTLAAEAEPEESSVSYPKKQSKWRRVASTLSILVLAPLIALLLTAFIFQSYEVDGVSMRTTLSDKDRLVIWKVPRTIARITGHAYVPHRDDIIVFNQLGLESDPSVNKQLIKRVIGLPGDRVVVQNDHILIYNAQHPNGYDPDVNHDFSPNIGHPTLGNVDITVKTGQVYVCGDNRTDSRDSRSFGPIEVHDIIGKLVVRIFPLNSFKSYI